MRAEINRLIEHPLFILSFLGVLATTQLVAFATQFFQGFIPFVTAPGRVMFSWDMFAPPIERCVLKWQPPLKIGPRSITSFNELGPTLEWDIAFERPEDYVDVGIRFGRQFGTQATKAQMRCFHLNGTSSENEFLCH